MPESQLLNSPGSLQPGQFLGPYRIESFVAAGGMGEVYRASDTRLNREVAIKVSAGRFSEHFAHEARVIASLNHPHICHLYDVGSNYLVMCRLQSVQDLSRVFDSPLERKRTSQRDFGLAKRSGPVPESDATLTAPLTGERQILGTLQYMSPEQLQGKDADARSDLFSFGCVLYEMLTGKRAFEGESAASLIAAILEREPAPLEVTPQLERVVRTCLAKDPDQRFQNALDLKRNLNWAVEQPAIARASSGRWFAAAVAVLVLAAFGGWWALFHFCQPAADAHVIRFQINPPEDGRFVEEGVLGGGLAVSPDGQSVVFNASGKGKRGLWIRPVDATSAQLLPGTEGAFFPFWSPDSKSIAFSLGATLQQIDLSRQTSSKICDIVGGTFSGGSWLEDGRILLSIRELGLFQVLASGGIPTPVALLDRSRGDVTYTDPGCFPAGACYTRCRAWSLRTSMRLRSINRPSESVW